MRPGSARLRAALVAGLLLVGVAPGCAHLEAGRLYESGTAALDRGDTATAIADLERAVRLVPDSTEVFNNLGIAYKDAGRFEEAQLAFQRAVDLDCDNQAAAVNLEAAHAHSATTVAQP